MSEDLDDDIAETARRVIRNEAHIRAVTDSIRKAARDAGIDDVSKHIAESCANAGRALFGPTGEQEAWMVYLILSTLVANAAHMSAGKAGVPREITLGVIISLAADQCQAADQLDHPGGNA